MKFKFIPALVVVSLSAFAQTKITSAMLGGYPARQIGPAEMSGRVTCIDAVNSNPRVFYVGSAGGGVWKTTNAGSTFKPLFDKYSQSIGWLAIDQKNPETVWVGTGECNMRNSVSVGTGLYKTTDGGRNWRKAGLDSCERISKVIIHPDNSDILYVSVPGALWSDSKHRGLYKSTDGGKTWNKILYTNEKTGCADVALDPKNPETVYASMWQFRRTPWSFSSGGPGSALYKSTDGGKTWKKIQNGFEPGELGRICIAISPTDPKHVYAIAESKNTALYDSKDGGETWEKKSATQNVTWRPFYFSLIKVDPVDDKRVYRPGLDFSFSDDAGESWKDASFEGGWVHSDHHALWINPNNNNHLIIGNDGGVYQSLDRGNSWTMFKNLPLSMFYHVTYDLETPYNVYGGLQDNGSWFAPYKSPDGVENKDWVNCGGGDGFWVQPDLSDKNIVYSESQGGAVTRFNKLTNESKDIMPYQLPGEKKMRFNWNTPIVGSPNNKARYYFGSQYLYRTANEGQSWERISPDLSTNNEKKQMQDSSGGLTVDNSGAENHCTIFTICESPKDENVIWAGTDDGNLQLTIDGAKTWTNVVKNVKGLPANTWVSSIDASLFDKNTCFVTFDNHAVGDMKTYVFKTTDMGKTWTSLSTSDLTGYAHKIKQDIKRENLLFLGTEFGLFISFDAGKNWVQYNAKMPMVPVRDIAIHPVTNDLILATHGRGVIILDDITPIRELTPAILESEMSFVPNRGTYIGSDRFGGAFPNGGYSAENPEEDLLITYYLNKRITQGDAKLEVYDASNNLIISLPASKRKGLNKVTWNMRTKPPRVAKGVKADFSGFIGPYAPEGTYKFKLIVNDKSLEKTIDLKCDPAAHISVEDMKLRHEVTMKIFALQENLALLSEQVRQVGDTAYARAEKLGSNKEYNPLLKTWDKKSNDVLKLMSASMAGTAITGEEKLREKIGMLYFKVSQSVSRPTDSQVEYIKALQREFDDIQKKADELFKTEVPKFNTVLAKNKLPEIKLITRDEWEVQTKKEQAGGKTGTGFEEEE
jgi:photosystem II stability/assembly factor-like uncharacterized protein